MNATRSILTVVLTASAMFAGCGKIDSTFKGGSAGNQAAQAYARNIHFELRAVRASEDEVVVSGVAANDGSRTVTYMKVRIALLNEKGAEVAVKTAELAGNQLFGDKTPIGPATAKPVKCSIKDSSWPGGRTKISITDIAIK